MVLPPFRLRILLTLLFVSAGGYAAGWWHHSRTMESGILAQSQGNAKIVSQRKGASSKINELAPSPSAVITELLTLGKGGSELASSLSTWATKDPEAAFAAFLADPRLQNSDCATSLFNALAAKDPVLALALLDQLPRKPWNKDAVKALANTWAGKDPTTAMAAGLALPPGARRRDFLSAACHTWLTSDVFSAAAWLKSLPSEEPVRNIIGKDHLFLGGMKSGEEMTALMQVHQLASGEQHTWLHHDFMHWSYRQPQEAIAWAFNLPPEAPKRSEIIDSALDAAAKDQDRALALLQTLVNPADRAKLLEKTASSWGNRDPEAAWQWAASITDPEAQKKAYAAIGKSWVTADPEKAVTFLQKEQPAEIDHWGPAAAEALGANSPDQALAWLRSLPADKQEILTVNTLQGIMKEDPGKALDYSHLISNDDRRHDLLRQATTELAKNDVTLASSRLSSMPASSDRDAAIAGLFQPAFEVEPDSALIWANSIQNQSNKVSTVTNGFQQWLRDDSAAAEAWLVRTPLDVDLRARLQGQIESQRKNPPQ